MSRIFSSHENHTTNLFDPIAKPTKSKGLSSRNLNTENNVLLKTNNLKSNTTAPTIKRKGLSDISNVINNTNKNINNNQKIQNIKLDIIKPKIETISEYNPYTDPSNPLSSIEHVYKEIIPPYEYNIDHLRNMKIIEKEKPEISPLPSRENEFFPSSNNENDSTDIKFDLPNFEIDLDIKFDVEENDIFDNIKFVDE